MTLSHIILIFLLATSLFASNISAKYKVSFGIFGELGIANTSLHVDEENRYKIVVHALTTGLANFLSGEREEWHISVGRVDKNGVLVPNYYEKTVRRYSSSDGETVLKKDIRKYIFNHDKKELKVQKTVLKGKKREFEEKDGDYYAPNDLLSLFFNFKKMLPSLEVKTASKFYAVGANKTDGRIDVIPLKKNKDLDWKEGHLMKVIINQKIFSSKKGELLINLGDDGLCKQAVLKDVLLFGDIRGELID
jgi:hypothetical protein